MRNEMAKGVLKKMLVDYKYYFSENDICALKTAIEALEKQTPKKPVKEMGEIVCPTCETLVGSRPYCGYCGQAIDWSKEE